MSDIMELVRRRQELLGAVEEMDRIGDDRVSYRMLSELAFRAEDLVKSWRAEHCTEVMAGGGYCGWPLAGYSDGATCGHNDES
jgi:hypothetical protein